jgi:hypothetical protein
MITRASQGRRTIATEPGGIAVVSMTFGALVDQVVFPLSNLDSD